MGRRGVLIEVILMDKDPLLQAWGSKTRKLTGWKDSAFIKNINIDFDSLLIIFDIPEWSIDAESLWFNWIGSNHTQN